jgi:hypothetical protein
MKSHLVFLEETTLYAKKTLSSIAIAKCWSRWEEIEKCIKILAYERNDE